MSHSSIPIESIVILHNNLTGLSARDPKRRHLQEEVAKSFSVSLSTIRRALRIYQKPRSIKRTDFNCPRNISAAEMLNYCELVAALKIRTTNKKGRHLSTPRILWILENHGIEIDGKKRMVPKGLLKKSTINRYLKRLGFSPKGLLLEPVVVHFQAEQSNDCWQLDFTSSELKKLPGESGAFDHGLLLASVVDDRSGVLYQEYFSSSGENALMALRFLFNAMAPKKQKVLQGIPKMLYLDNGPVAKSLIFRRVMEQLGIQVLTHLPQGKDGRRTTARSKGKVERPFRTVQDGFETLYHFHKPQTLKEANEWLWNYLAHYNTMPHRIEEHSRLEDWKEKLPADGYREMCSWERFSQIAREPCLRHVGSDACITLEGTSYQLKAEMAGEKVIALLGIFDTEIYVEFQGKKEGPFYPASGPIPLHTYRPFKKTYKEKQLDALSELAKRVTLPRSVLSGEQESETLQLITQAHLLAEEKIISVPFTEKDDAEIAYFKTPLDAKLAIVSFLGRPLATLEVTQRQQIDAFVTQTLHKETLLKQVKSYFQPRLYQSNLKEQK
jgi:transposase InsO family protein